MALNNLTALGLDLKRVIATVSKDKNLDRSIITTALEEAFVHAARRKLGMEADLEAHFNEESDEIELFQFQVVVEKILNENSEIILEQALKLDPEAELGDSVGVKLELQEFGRIAVRSAKQIIVQRVREAERKKVYEEFKERVGEVICGHVRRFEHQDIIVDLGDTEAVLPYGEQIPSDRFNSKDRIQAYVLDVKKVSRGPQIILSRSAPEFLVKLFEESVTEVYDGIVVIEHAARDPGLRAKIAVHSKDAAVDPVGACVGMKGSRVQMIVQELSGEKIDIISWEQDPAKLVCNALSPAIICKVIVDEENHSMDVVVSNDQLSLAIGKRGQNVRLAAQLTGWRLDIKSQEKLEEQLSTIKISLKSIPSLGAMQAEILVNEGVKSVGDIAQFNERTLVRLLNLSESEATKIIAEAKNIQEEPLEKEVSESEDLLANASAVPLQIEDSVEEKKADVFLELSGVGEAAAYALADANYATIGDVLADSAEEVAQKTGLAISTARTIQIAADRFLQRERQATKTENLN